MSDLYTGKINEFVDWMSGENSFTGKNDTGGLQVSGGSIRELIQRKLKNPFYMYEDTANNKYRMFSSEEAFAIWKENPTENSDLELFNFVRPSDYKLELTATDAGGFNNKFVRYGDSNNIGSRISYSWRIYNDEGESTDSISVTYTISNTVTGSSTTFSRWYNKSDADPNFSIYEYLQPGENAVSIEAKGITTGARNTRTFTIVLLQLNITSSFRFYEKITNGSPIQVPYVFERNNTSGTAKIYFQIDEGGEGKIYAKDVVQDGPTKVTEIQQLAINLSEGTHSLQIWAEGKYNDGNTTVNSNLLYYTFTVASSVIGSTNKFININAQFISGNFPLSSLMLNATQYEPQTIEWGYYTDSLQTNTSIPVTWKLLQGLDDENPILLSQATANNQEKAPNLQFIPTIYTQEGIDTYIAAYYNNTQIGLYPIYIVKNTKIIVNETGFYELKMSAYGKTNDSNIKDVWTDESGNVSTTFTGVMWNTNSGWNNNSFRTSGTSEYATINFQPFQNFSFTNGKTIEIEFESEKVSSEDDKIIIIGNPSGARIEITPDTATLYNNANREVVHTNYKYNERIKLAFIINNIPEDQENRTIQSGLAYIVNNGILERASIASGQSFQTTGNIKIGGSNSGVKVYNIRIYNYAITYNDAYNNFLFDSENKSSIASNNNILDAGGNISFDLCKNKIDTILITGNLSNILSGQTNKDDSTTDVTIERFCPSDASKNFKINNVQIRKHGQSTLNYPITSMKFWLNKAKGLETPTYETTQQADLLLNKNRYVMKSGTDTLAGNAIIQGSKPSIPANKFVLQANYADSSGVHNGSLQRLMQVSWFNAQIDNEYKLRTEPQLFSTSQLVHHNDENLGETGNWVEGYGSRNGNPILWESVTNSQFPYDIRIAPDSFPCAVFYYDEQGSKTRTFLGQYVFMDDKKSDFSYGERSIYAVPSDPFCLTTTHKSEDTSANKVWDNGKVLRIEVVGSNVPFTSYMTHNNFTDIISIEDESTGNITRMYNWEQAFELVFPDEDDLAKDDAKAGINKFNPASKYVQKVQPFINFHEWVVSTYQNQSKFQLEAAQHLDLYKMAAYYIFCMRFGLVDSLERNAQLKTYDGIHWHYEPWDMDIALGNKNDGGIAYDPPIDRNTKLPGSVTTYAFSGRSDNQDGTRATSNWLWDALEAWPYWANTVVPKVADALYNAGLSYDNVSKMFDDDYAAKWCEIMYNESGYFKYVESGKGDPTWLSWLQGSRMTHRHWWLSNSMDYYDAKWFCGDYKNHYIYLRANVTEGSNVNISITPNKSAYMSVMKDGVLQATQAVNKNQPLLYSMSGGSNTKNPITIFGANFMESIDLSQIATGFDGVELNGIYSEVLGSPLKSLNVGTPLTQTQTGYTTTIAVLGCQLQGQARIFENLQSLNIRGQRSQTDSNALIHNNDMSELKEFLAMGSGISNFYSSQSGNDFTKIEIPSDVYTIWMNNSSWQEMEFWDCVINENDNDAVLTQVQGVPADVHEVSFLGSTGSTRESAIFVKNWLASIDAANGDYSQYFLEMDKVNWSETTVGANNLLTYEELGRIAQMRNAGSSIKGYIVLKDTGVDLTSAQLNNIKSWFGDTVFTKNSSGLVVDHKREYIQINIGGNVTVDPMSGEVTLHEGNTASLNATRFTLAEDDVTNYSWSISAPSSIDAYIRYNGLTVIQADESIDGIAYISSQQSQIGENYDVKVTCSVAGVNYSTIIHVVAASYPNSMFIDSTNLANVAPRVVPGGICLYTSGQKANLFVSSNDEYTAEINKITYTIQRRGSNDSATYIDRGSSEQLENLHDDYLTLSAGITKGIKVSADSAVPQDLEIYDISADILFKSGTRISTSSIIAVGDDASPVIMSNQSILYNIVNSAWTEEFGAPIGRNNFYKIDLFIMSGTIDFSIDSENVTNVTTVDGQYLFKYLPNCTEIILDNCTQLTSLNNNNINQTNFSNMIHLQKLSIQNCTGLTEDIDLTACTDIREVDASNTNINVLIPNGAKLTKYELGTPTTVIINNPTQLLPANILIDDAQNITNIQLRNINSQQNYGYKALEKILFGNQQNEQQQQFTFYYEKRLVQDGTIADEPNNNNYWVSEEVDVSGVSSVNLVRSFNMDDFLIVEYDSSHNYIDYWKFNYISRNVNLNSNTKYLRMGVIGYQNNTLNVLFVKVTSAADNTILCEWIKNMQS